ncbi:MAG: aldehyde dehydrogenase family protein, partial [Chloroflexi bacterium]|nr:aldehyde dehydrogenase family protein [Chloroflexota bacterium]
MVIQSSTLASINPTTEELLASFATATAAQVEAALSEALTGFAAWSRSGIAERAERLRRAAAHLRQNQDHYARLITLEMGKPISQAAAEIAKCARNCEFYGEHAERFLADQPVRTDARDSYVAFDPLGVILAVMPWNFPFWQVFRFAAPALVAGNVAILKHSSNVPQCALAIEQVFRESGFPRGVFATLLLPSSGIPALIADPRIQAVTLTGSDLAGAQIAEAAGRTLKKTVLELGGSDPFIVLEDADVRAAAEVAAVARTQNTGQSCIAAKRFIVVADVADEFERRFSETMASLRVGDPLDPETQVGPLARADLRDDLGGQVRASVEQGARVVIGGNRLPGRGCFFEPTILADVAPSMPAWREETFGPVAALVRAANAAEAIALANDSRYGLGANLWTTDLDRARLLARQIEAGSV